MSLPPYNISLLFGYVALISTSWPVYVLMSTKVDSHMTMSRSIVKLVHGWNMVHGRGKMMKTILSSNQHSFFRSYRICLAVAEQLYSRHYSAFLMVFGCNGVGCSTEELLWWFWHRLKGQWSKLLAYTITKVMLWFFYTSNKFFPFISLMGNPP